MTAQVNPQPISGWVITSQTPATQVSAAGQVEEGMTVAFRTGNGVSASAFVPWSNYTKDGISAVVNARAAALDAAFQLTDKG